MLNKLTKSVLLLLLLNSSVLAAQQEEVKGQVVLERFYGPPNYGESANDSVEVLPVLYFERAHQAQGQLIDAALLRGKSKVVPGCYQVTGSFSAAASGHDYTALVLDFSKLRPASNCSILLPENTNCSAQRVESFSNYWRRFRAAGLQSCKVLNKIRSGVLTSKGTLDFSPEHKLSGNTFIQQCSHWMQTPQEFSQPTTLAIFLRQHAVAPSGWRNGGDDQARVGPLLFERSKGCWQWSTFYRAE